MVLEFVKILFNNNLKNTFNCFVPDNFVVIWKPSVVQEESAGNLLMDTDEAENKETWTAVKMLR